MTFPGATTFRIGRFLLATVLMAFAMAGCSPKPPEPIPILMYHHVAQDPGDDVWTVSSEEFRRQIAELKAAGFQTLLPEDLAKVRRWKFGLPRKPILLTFDDGLRSTLVEVEPILRQAGFRAICYLITGSISDAPAERMPYRSYDCLTWEEIRAMQGRGTIVFGIHSHSHASDPARVAMEVAECRNIFRQKTGKPTRDFCYPHGSAPDSLVQAVSNAGYRTAMVCQDRMFIPGPGADFLRIPRVSVYGGHHEFSATAISRSEEGAFCTEVQNRGVPLPVRGVLRDQQTDRLWALQPSNRLDAKAQRWCWPSLPSDVSATSLQIEIQEQNGLFGYYP